ncbi:hypothetical protein B0J11DRAFT_582191 [Dendryphion nanum]|uniref:Uncharacterized protein n=1 Tax=Dendryphion nanum TaxID=256645 RepID=A0A9P9DI85_9PLEO|nr:hypothetical protein B0J11DRAFT_582191 [Dendryphion nanum]
MSIHLHVASKPHRPSFKGRARILLRASEPPESPLLNGTICEAIELDGGPCRLSLPKSANIWCHKHVLELGELHKAWGAAQIEAESVSVTSHDTAKKKVIKLKRAVELRRQIRERFYARGGDTADFLKWITRLEKTVQGLADSLLKTSVRYDIIRPTTPGFANKSGKITVLRPSLQNTRTTVESLNGIIDDGTITVLRHFYADLCREGLRQLYAIVPDLNDSGSVSNPEYPKGTPILDTGTDVIRAWFRIMVLHDSERDTIELMKSKRSIHDFLLECNSSQLELYCDSFEKAWRHRSLRYLRQAICMQHHEGEDIETVEILGGKVPKRDNGFRMTKPCWDFLNRWFPTLLTPWTIAGICTNFDEFTTICKLLMVGLYREQWYDPASVLTECRTGVYLGFIPSLKGDLASREDLNYDSMAEVHREWRNYVCGQMPMGTPLTLKFLGEIRKRSGRLIVSVFEGNDAVVTTNEKDITVERYRVGNNAWTNGITIEDIRNEVRMTKPHMYDPVVGDSWHFIILDREMNLPFALFDIVQDILLMLVGDPTAREIGKRVVQDVIPHSAQKTVLEEIVIDMPLEMRFPAPSEIQYEGNRLRCFDPNRHAVFQHQSKIRSSPYARNENRFIRRVVSDLERAGLIRLAPTYEEPQTKPVIVQGTDGGQDLYFPYEFGGPALTAPTSLLKMPASTCLLDFAKKFKEKHPSAIMAKGSIKTHYCAWPMPAVRGAGKAKLNFSTWEGHIYHWRAMPFDRPWSENAWQYYLQYYINSKFTFVMFYLTTFVICAVDAVDAGRGVSMLLEETEKREWTITVPGLEDWTSNIEQLKLDELFAGIRPKYDRTSKRLSG